MQTRKLPGIPYSTHHNINKIDHNFHRRLKTEVQRPDFLQKMILDREKTGTTFQDLRSQASLLTIAGSETTATALSGIMYYLCRNSHVYNNLAKEIRENFSCFKQIDGRSTEALPYVKVVIAEGLRIYPTVAFGLPRVSNGSARNWQVVTRVN